MEEMVHSARQVGRQEKEKRTNLECADRKRRLRMSGISTMTQPNSARTPLSPLSPQELEQKQTSSEISREAIELLKSVSVSPSSHDESVLGVSTSPCVAGFVRRDPSARCEGGRIMRKRDVRMGETTPRRPAGSEEGNSQSSTRRVNVNEFQAEVNEISPTSRRKMFTVASSGLGTDDEEVHQNREKKRKPRRGNLVAKESYVKEIFGKYSSRCDNLEESAKVRGALSEICASFNVDANDRAQLWSVCSELPLPITRSQFVSVVLEKLWCVKKSGVSTPVWKQEQLSFIENQMAKVGMLDVKPGGSTTGSRANSRAASTANSRSNSRAPSKHGSRVGSKMASRAGSAAVSQSATPRGRSINYGRCGSRGFDLSQEADKEGQHMRNLKMLPAENILLKGKMHRPISPNKSPKAKGTSNEAPPFPTKIREAMDVDDVLCMVNQRLLLDSSPETA